ncbi:MAG: hypothetical protein ACRDIY_22605 [Chloroflexota bacterium]
MNLHALQQELADYENDATLVEEMNLDGRARALDFAVFLDQVARLNRPSDELTALKERADALRARLLPINARLFRELRERIRRGTETPHQLRRELDQFTRYAPESTGQTHFGFDGLDLLLDGVFDIGKPPFLARSPLPDMIHYEPTPARVVLDLVDHAGIRPDDVFYDLGSGLGRVVMLVSLLAGCRAVGVEYQSDYTAYARRCAEELRVTRVEWITADAREVDYANGTVFYLFTPFKGAMLAAVLERLRQAARQRRLTICGYGPCTRVLFEQSWLRPLDPTANHDYRLSIFRAG